QTFLSLVMFDTELEIKYTALQRKSLAVGKRNLEHCLCERLSRQKSGFGETIRNQPEALFVVQVITHMRKRAKHHAVISGIKPGTVSRDNTYIDL
ncbi:hypothetical protein ALP68_02782, partial [Pseudomonas ficuserectae]